MNPLPVRRAEPFYRFFLFILFLQALGAYSIGGVPIQWIAMTALICLAIWFLGRGTVVFPPGFQLFILFALFATFVTILNTTGDDVSYLLPEKATTGYITYISLRFMTFWAFIAATFCTFHFCHRLGFKRVSEDVVTIGVIIGLFALYVYVAQITGLPEPPRTRAGTDGGEQAVVFSYAFHRAMGSFREPSHLAEWLVLPFFLSMTSSRFSTLKSFVMLGALLLTGSLTGFLSIGIGLAVACLMHLNRIRHITVNLLKLMMPLGLAALGFSLMVKTGSGYNGFFDTIWTRIEPMLTEHGASKTNRNYIYAYLDQHRASLLGEGFGNSNLIFGNVLHIDSTVSFLNLYVNVLFSLGYIGLTILILLIVYPLWFRFLKGRQSNEYIFVWAAYFAWLVAFFAHAEEFSVHFGVVYAFLVYGIATSNSRLNESLAAG